MTVQRDDAWAAAEAVASQQRELRLHPSSRKRAAGRWLLPAAVSVWLMTLACFFVAVFGRADIRDGMQAAGDVGLVLCLVFGFWWLVWSGRYLTRRSGGSIRRAIPAAAWLNVRQQLRGRLPLDPAHADVVIELARQQQRLLTGQIGYLVIYLPLFFNLVRADYPLGTPLAVAFIGTVVSVAALTVAAHRRLDYLLSANPSPA